MWKLHLRALAFLGLGLCACQGAQTQYSAAEDVRAFILAVQENDQQAFERHVDREQLRTQLTTVVQRELGQEGGLGSAFAGALAEGAADQLIRPESFQYALQQAGAPARTPTAAEIATQLRVVENGRVCLPRSKDGPCAITFEEQGQDWKLVALEPGDIKLGDIPMGGR